jgi:hypothetical protein
MNMRRVLQNRIRGWLPKEPYLPSYSIANPESKPRQKTQLPKGRILITGSWAVLSVINLLAGNPSGVLYLWCTAIWGVSLALDSSVLCGRESHPKGASALLLAVICLGSILTTVYVFSVPSGFLLRAVVLGMLAVVHVTLLAAVVAAGLGKKALARKLFCWFTLRRN